MAAPPLPKPSASGDVWVLVSLSPAEWERTAKDKPARLLALGTRTSLSTELFAKPSGLPPVEDPKRSMLSLYYVVPGKDHGLDVNNRLRVELPMQGSEEKQKVVPYSAVYYDGKGTPWVYVTSTPLVYERQRVGVERVAGDLAVLSEGPPVGTSVVSVGASLLFGTEIFGK
jgi:multidrug efflux pump subunit AcrA (membrane-fusion protein)